MAPVRLSVPRPAELAAVLAALRSWQSDAAPVPLHPGDLGWHHLRGADATAAALRLWRRGDRPVAVGLLDGQRLLRLALAPEVLEDQELAAAVGEDIADPERAVLPTGTAAVEARSAPALRRRLLARGWTEGEPWVPLRRDLAEPVEESASPVLSISPVRDTDLAEYAAVHRAAFGSSGVTAQRLRTMLAGPAHREAVSLLGRDAAGTAVAVLTAWSAGPGRPGLIEPLGVHPEHRGGGHGRAMCLAAAAWLHRAGASSADVCTPRSLAAAVATYRSAGYRALSDVPDLERPGP